MWLKFCMWGKGGEMKWERGKKGNGNEVIVMLIYFIFEDF